MTNSPENNGTPDRPTFKSGQEVDVVVLQPKDEGRLPLVIPVTPETASEIASRYGQPNNDGVSEMTVDTHTQLVGTVLGDQDGDPVVVPAMASIQVPRAVQVSRSANKTVDYDTYRGNFDQIFGTKKQMGQG